MRAHRVASPAALTHPIHPESPMAKTSLADALTGVLAQTYALAVKTHAAHWNVTGPQFFHLHAAFADQYEALFEAADDLAERLRAIGAKAPTGIADLAKRSGLAPIPGGEGLALARALAVDHRGLAASCAAVARAAASGGDEATADLLIGRIEAHDKTAWMLESTAG
jgi:starvation-inducible DNA-binding protein